MSDDTKTKKEPLLSDDDSELDLGSSSTEYYKMSSYQHSIDKLSEEDLQRYETFRRSNFPKNNVKKFISSVIGQAVNPNMVIAVSGIAKVFVGEMVELALSIQKEKNEMGPLLPSHIHEAHRRMYKKIPHNSVFKNAPWNN